MSTYSPCRCGCQPLVLTGCGCKECGPGRGIDHEGNSRRLSVGRKIRMNALLARDFEKLSPLEKAELDDLLGLYLYTG